MVAAVACLEPGCYQFSVDVSQGMYNYEIGWSLGGVEPVGLSGAWNDVAEFTVGDGGDDLGCMDESACNFDASALCDDGSCCYDLCVDLTMTDSFGDGWNNATMTLTNPNTGYTQDFTLSDGEAETVVLCLEPGCYDVVVTGGFYPSEVGWTLDYNGAGSFGGAPHDGYFTLEVVVGCTDSYACNYNPDATCSDSSCQYPGCLDPSACNYNSMTMCGDASLCDYGCAGCTYPLATNYDPAATMDDGSCQFDVAPPPNDCSSDLDGDGQIAVNDLLIVLGQFGESCDPDNGGE